MKHFHATKISRHVLSVTHGVKNLPILPHLCSFVLVTAYGKHCSICSGSSSLSMAEKEPLSDDQELMRAEGRTGLP